MYESAVERAWQLLQYETQIQEGQGEQSRLALFILPQSHASLTESDGQALQAEDDAAFL